MNRLDVQRSMKEKKKSSARAEQPLNSRLDDPYRFRYSNDIQQGAARAESELS